MWSSPVLLVVLVVTLTTASTPNVPAVSSRPLSSKSPVTTTMATLTPATTTPATTTPAPTTPQHHRRPPVTTTTTTPPAAPSYSVVTTTTVLRINAASNASAMKGGSSGVLGPGFEVVDVPLRGPGNWTLTTSASTSQTLQCGALMSPVLQQVVVGATQSCQLEISSTSSEASLTWQLIPIT